MKKVLVLSVIALASCGKFKFENKIQGEWKMSEARLQGELSWVAFPESEPLVTITESNISQPWNTSYSVSGKTIIMNNQTIKVEVKKHDMLWVFDNTDSLRFTR
jgi:hypothetical protein